jgi:membrane-associated protease RseP (regulator of RpoE activity)
VQDSSSDYFTSSVNVEPIEESAPLEQAQQPLGARSMALAVLLFVVTFVSTTYVGAAQTSGEGASFWSGLSYSVPLMAILLAHELGHYIAARIHRVPASPPFFVPMPVPPLGTMGAVILMRGRIARRNALLDIGAAGPLAGMAVALPVLIYGLIHSEVSAVQPGVGYLMEGRSLLYLGLLRLLKGPIPDGYDIMLSPTAFAGWAGMMVTMINLIPAAQLDGGHVAYALFGEKQERYSRWVRRGLLPIAALVSLYYGLPGLFDGKHGEALQAGFAPGLQWLLWWVLLRFLVKRGQREHPQTDLGPLSPRRRLVAIGTLFLFVLLFMPAWMRDIPPS